MLDALVSTRGKGTTSKATGSLGTGEKRKKRESRDHRREHNIWNRVIKEAEEGEEKRTRTHKI